MTAWSLNNKNITTTGATWQDCHFFLAPTRSMQWGVFANRPFERGETVHVVGLTFLPMSPHRPAVERGSVLGDYVYGYWQIDHDKVMQLYSILLGPDMMYNHHPTDPNVEFQTFGREPNAGLETAMNPQGFVARRDIQRGEELFSTYKHGNQLDGGVGWFQAREIVMEEPDDDGSSLDRRRWCCLSVDLLGAQTCLLLHFEMTVPLKAAAQLLHHVSTTTSNFGYLIS
jgi:hypothetical protein